MTGDADDAVAADHESTLIAAARCEAADFTEAAQLARPPPDAVPGFEIIRELGRGGMGVVYQALQRSTRRVVALKVMLAGAFASPTAQKRFQREVELAARCQHAGVVRVLESGFTAGGQRYYAMDYVDGVRLDYWLATLQPDVRTTLRLFVDICAAVEHAHQHDVIHRDLKPANVLIDAEGAPHVLDFGLAKPTDRASLEDSLAVTAATSAQILGTLRYMSPEQAAGTLGEIDARTDVYALGVVLFEALTGQLPFDSTGQPAEVLRRIVEQPPRRPSALTKAVDAELETILLKALEKEQARRYQSARELGEDLGRYLAGDPIRARRPSVRYVLGKKLRKHRWQLVTASVAMVLVVALLVLNAWWQRRELFQARLDAVELLHGMEETGLPDLGGARALCARYPYLRDAHLVYAQAVYRNKDQRMPQAAQNAVGHLDRTMGPNPSKSFWPYLALQAELYHVIGDEERAAKLAADPERAAPDTADAWHLRSLATLQIPKALRCAQEAVARDPTHRPAWRRLTYLRLQTRDLDGALQGVEHLIALGDKPHASSLVSASPAHWLLFKGHILLRQGRVWEAIEQYSAAIKQGRTTAANLYRAHAYRRLREYDLAVADYTRVIEDCRRNREESAAMWHIYQRATPLWILGRTEEALRDYCDVRRLLGRPSYGDARAFLILREQGRVAEANEVLAAALRDVADAWLRQVFRCLAGALTPAALVAEAEGRGNLEQLCEACYYAGEACLLNGERAAARTWFDRAVATALAYDPDAGSETPMNEYELARWRLETLGAETQAAGRP